MLYADPERGHRVKETVPIGPVTCYLLELLDRCDRCLSIALGFREDRGSGESWERGPYFLDGLVPLAYLLDDSKLIAKANQWVSWTLDHQRPEGSIGPEKNKDWWPNMIMLKVLTQYQEATGDPRVIPVMERYFLHQLGLLSERPLKEWAIFRWGDELLSVLWLYNRNGDPRLLELARALQKQGYDWKGHFADFQFRDKVQKAQANLKSHVVNNAMALKTSAVWWLVSADRSDRDSSYHQLEEMDRYHLLPNGVHSGDEHYAGRDPSQGTELCAVVEGMFSLEHLTAIYGDPAFGDRLEKISYNALPGTFSGDMWAHQYDQQPNQVLCNIYAREWTTNGPEGGRINALAIDPAAAATLYAGTGGGVFKSTNAGGSWSAINTGLTNTSVFSLAIDPTNGSTLYAGTYGGGVFRLRPGLLSRGR